MSEHVHQESTGSEAAANTPQGEPPQQKPPVMHSITDRLAKGNRAVGILAALAMIALGIVIMVMPVKSAIVVMDIATVGFIIYGIYQIIIYFRTPSEYKNGWLIANGIIFILLGVMVLRISTLGTAIMFAFLLGFLALSSGLTQIASYGAYKKAGAQNAGGLIASGILNIMLGLFFLFSPFVTTLVMWFIFAIYLVVAGIAVFAQAASGRHVREQKSE